MTNKLTPLDIEVLLHAYNDDRGYTPHPTNKLKFDALQNLFKYKLVEEVSVACYILTTGGRMLVEALCSTPIPVQKWVIPGMNE